MREMSSNILSLIRLGFLPPDFSRDDLESTLWYILWDTFRGLCVHAEVVTLTPPTFNCRRLGGPCDFDQCPLVAEAIKRFERRLKRKRYEL